MKVVIEVELGNDAMQTASDLSHSIQKALASSGKLFDPLEEGEYGLVRDGNGNTVGAWAVKAAC